MDKAEVRQIARFLLECQEALYEWDGTATMTLYREYGTGHEIRKVCGKWESAEVAFGG
jgi:hypothetical protein